MIEKMTGFPNSMCSVYLDPTINAREQTGVLRICDVQTQHMVDLRSLQFKQYFPHAKMSQTLYFGLYSVAAYGDLGHEDVAKYG